MVNLNLKPFEIGAVVIALVLCGFLISSHFMTGTTAPETAAPSVKQTTPAIPPYTPAIAAQLAQSHGFQMLVSYTNNGFEPATTTIHRHETIRFTDNSNNLSLWIGQVTPNNTPQNPNTLNCDVTFNTCHAMKQTDFWEHTFDATGTFEYINNEHPEDQGVVYVTD